MTNRNEYFNEKHTFDNLQPYQIELFQFTELAGLNVNPLFIWILLQMLNMKIPPEAVYKLLKSIKKSVKISKTKGESTGK